MMYSQSSDDSVTGHAIQSTQTDKT